MWSYVGRRLLIAVFVIFAASYLVYVLSANSGDPLEALRGSTAPNKEQLMAALTAQLHLDVPPFLRYFIWLGGVFHGDLGTTITGISVNTLLAQSAWSTIQLVTTATILAMFFGISIGMISALRQYSGFDYSVTFVAFIFFALPTFWVGQLLKLNVAIAFNNFLANPFVAPIAIFLLSLAGAFIWASAMGGQLKRFSINFAGAFVAVAAVLIYTNAHGLLPVPQPRAGVDRAPGRCGSDRDHPADHGPLQPQGAVLRAHRRGARRRAVVAGPVRVLLLARRGAPCSCSPCAPSPSVHSSAGCGAATTARSRSARRCSPPSSPHCSP